MKGGGKPDLSVHHLRYLQIDDTTFGSKPEKCIHLVSSNLFEISRARVKQQLLLKTSRSESLIRSQVPSVVTLFRLLERGSYKSQQSSYKVKLE